MAEPSAHLVSRSLYRSTQTREAVWNLIDGVEIPADQRSRLSGGCCYAVLDLHSATILLAREGLFPSAFVLARPIWEAVIRGLWLANCASPEQLAAFAADEECPKPWAMIGDLESLGAFDSAVLSKVHSNNWRRLNGLTHIGGPMAVRCNSPSHVTYNFSAAEILECLQHANALALLAGLGIAMLANDGALAERLLELAS